ncbi:hypothetical protein FB451DRAFT_1559251 [Mycena latifolia]|nr:hypothetical protein FB451DRAFT_1559251 [Mycena latifolia]
MSTLKIFFIPRLLVDGANWIPSGRSYGPFDPNHGLVPADATEELDIRCSADLPLRWNEFHDEIRPMLVLPSTESASPRSLLYHHVHGDGLLSYNRVAAFRDIVEQQLLKCYFLEQPDHQNRDPSTIISILTMYHFMRFSDRVVELKLWACMVDDVRQYLASRDRVLEEMYRRCSAWAKIYFTARTVIGTLPNPLVSTSSCAPTHCLDAGPLESSGSGTEGSSDDVLLPSSPNGTTWAMTDAVSTGVHDTSLFRHRAHRRLGSE